MIALSAHDKVLNIFSLPFVGRKAVEIHMNLGDFPVIAAVRTDKEFANVLKSPVETVFLLHADILTVKEQINLAKAAGKDVFVHIDMADGIGKDKKGAAYVASLGAAGIISTRPALIKAAKETGLRTIMRFFVIDSHSIGTAAENIKNSSPDMVEMMPGILPDIIADFKKNISIPIIAGGLIKSKNDIYRALSAGAKAISTGKQELWNS